MSDVMTFNNGLSPEHDDAINDIMIDLQRINSRIRELGNHRSYLLAQTKIEEAFHWMRDRKQARITGATGKVSMTYDQWKTTDPRDGDYDSQDDVTELDVLYDELREAKLDAKHVKVTADARIAALTLALQEALEYFKDRYDVKDGSEGTQLPNEEMRIGMMIDETLYGIRF